MSSTVVAAVVLCAQQSKQPLVALPSGFRVHNGTKIAFHVPIVPREKRRRIKFAVLKGPRPTKAHLGRKDGRDVQVVKLELWINMTSGDGKLDSFGDEEHNVWNLSMGVAVGREGELCKVSFSFQFALDQVSRVRRRNGARSSGGDKMKEHTMKVVV